MSQWDYKIDQPMPGPFPTSIPGPFLKLREGKGDRKIYFYLRPKNTSRPQNVKVSVNVLDDSVIKILPVVIDSPIINFEEFS